MLLIVLKANIKILQRKMLIYTEGLFRPQKERKLERASIHLHDVQMRKVTNFQSSCKSSLAKLDTYSKQDEMATFNEKLSNKAFFLGAISAAQVIVVTLCLHFDFPV